MPDSKPKVFVASSSEGLSAAHALQENLERYAEVTVWPQGVFNLSEVPVDDLTAQLQASDFGIFLFAFEDVTVIRQVKRKTVRDNVLLELGMALGQLGRQRCLLVLAKQDEARFHLPTDLLGLTTASFDPRRTDGNLTAALGPASNQIARSMDRIGCRIQAQSSSGFTGLVSPSPATPKSAVLNGLVNGALETVCRAVSLPRTPESASLRVFIFRADQKALVCSHYWAPNPVREMVNRLRFMIDSESSESLAVVRAFVTDEVVRAPLDSGHQQQLAQHAPVSGEIDYVSAWPIHVNETLWGVVSFDASNTAGVELLDSAVSDAAMLRLSQHLGLIFAAHNDA